MGRKRYVSSDISNDDKLAAVAEESNQAAMMWPWVLTGLDDWGRMKGSVRELQYGPLSLFRELTRDDVGNMIVLYHRHGLMHRYEVDGHPYLQANPRSFYEIQTYIQKSRQMHDGSKLPPPQDHPWGQFWMTSDWNEKGQRKTATNGEE